MEQLIKNLTSAVSDFVAESNKDRGDDDALNEPLRRCCFILGLDWHEHLLGNGVIEIIYGKGWKVVGLEFIVDNHKITITVK